MTRLVTLFLAFGLVAAHASVQAGAQQTEITPRASTGIQPGASRFPDKTELLRSIDLYESAARKADATHAGDAEQIRIYTSLGSLYLDAALYLKSEDAMRRVISLLQHGSQTALAEEIGQLAILHIAMGDMKQADKDHLQVLRVREAIGDPLGIALTWNDLADLYVKQHQFAKGLDYAQRAMTVLADNPAVLPTDRVAVRQTMAFALCGVHQCSQAIPLLQDSIELARTSFGPDSLSVGLGSYLLGYVCWQNGQTDEAAEWMQRGTARMKVDWGWGHVLYVNAMQQYAKFLRQRGQTESAQVAEREVHQMQAVVDARSFTAR